MRYRLSPGVELDVLNQAELHETLQNLLSGFSRGPATQRAANPLLLDGSGNTTVGSTSPAPVALFKVPAGAQFGLHRLAIKPDGYTFGTPYTHAEAYLEIQRNGLMMDGIPLTSPGLPRVFTAGSGDAIVYDNNETVDLLVVGGPASTPLQVVLQGTLEPLEIT